MRKGGNKKIYIFSGLVRKVCYRHRTADISAISAAKRAQLFGTHRSRIKSANLLRTQCLRLLLRQLVTAISRNPCNISKVNLDDLPFYGRRIYINIFKSQNNWQLKICRNLSIPNPSNEFCKKKKTIFCA